MLARGSENPGRYLWGGPKPHRELVIMMKKDGHVLTSSLV